MQFFEDFRELADDRVHQCAALSLERALTNPVCGDEVVVWFQLEGEEVVSMTYLARGCWPVYGALEYLARGACGRKVTDCAALRMNEFLESVEGIPGSKRHAFSLAHRAYLRGLVEAVASGDNMDVRPIGTGVQERV